MNEDVVCLSLAQGIEAMALLALEKTGSQIAAGSPVKPGDTSVQHLQILQSRCLAVSRKQHFIKCPVSRVSKWKFKGQIPHKWEA